jgi:hypothetical protein
MRRQERIERGTIDLRQRPQDRRMDSLPGSRRRCTSSKAGIAYSPESIEQADAVLECSRRARETLNIAADPQRIGLDQALTFTQHVAENAFARISPMDRVADQGHAGSRADRDSASENSSRATAIRILIQQARLEVRVGDVEAPDRGEVPAVVGLRTFARGRPEQSLVNLLGIVARGGRPRHPAPSGAPPHHAAPRRVVLNLEHAANRSGVTSISSSLPKGILGGVIVLQRGSRPLRRLPDLIRLRWRPGSAARRCPERRRVQSQTA